MLIYIFKDGKGERYVASEKEAHNKIRNSGNWERQDLKYLGACEDIISIMAADRREEAIQRVIKESEEIKNLDLQINVATLEENLKDVSLFTSKKSLVESSIRISVNKLGTLDDIPTPKDDQLRMKYIKYINELEKEEVNKLEPDGKIFPKDFSRVEHKFAGKEAE